MALAEIRGLSYSYPQVAVPALREVSLAIEAGERVALLGASGSGKSTLLRALAALVPHFHGGRLEGRVEVAGLDTRRARPAELAGTVATVFQDPEDQVVMARVANEVAFGLENLGVAPAAMPARIATALGAVGAGHLVERPTAELSAGELQRVCLAAALALEPRLLLLDEPTSELDPGGAGDLLDALERLEAAVVLSEQRTARALAFADRVLFLEGGRLLLDAGLAEALTWLEEHRPAYVPADDVGDLPGTPGDGVVVSVSDVAFSYAPGVPVLAGASLEVRRGEVVALVGENGSGKTTLAKIAAGLLQPHSGSVRRVGRAGYVSQDPGRYVVRERVDDEVALAVNGDRERAVAALEGFGLGWAAARHPRDLSSGERERLALAAVAVSEPDLLVLDEPTRGIDPERKAALADWIEAYAAAGRGVLVVTHDGGLAAHRRVTPGAREAVLA
ncbi:MAG TPA: ABC transporter ATP-binding protein [Gaiellaceae bacterium]|nr:ABC transporter ATP-binding protein [Gaiellaceae bacterium]